MFRIFVVSVFLSVGVLAGCSSDSGCGRIADVAQECDPSITDEDRRASVEICEALIPSSAANRCANCLESAADPCGDSCDAACGDD